ncbi:ImmA/IrrE family metallo-endopeptidase [Deinococcus frigens]|uniref:ImmA/IrrE family metallo-endopeptidase n=1 Tax=Deinococcus frigens TaxID=249403 RepID=UPI00138E2126|nr:ImmA/IrrE family metallo-endopeptidase [Deinococcus frigens]
MLIQLTQAYRKAVVDLRPAAPPSTVPDIRLCRAELGTLTPAEVTAIEAFQQFCKRFAGLLRTVGGSLPRPNLLSLEPGTSLTRRYAVEADADESRRAWDLSSLTPTGSELFDHLEDHGVAVDRHTVLASQLSRASLNHAGLGPAILVNASETPPRQVFTAAHELAHLLYHLQSDVGGLFVSRKLDTAAEQLANDLAPAFLMPATGTDLFLSRRGPRDEQVGFADFYHLKAAFQSQLRGHNCPTTQAGTSERHCPL